MPNGISQSPEELLDKIKSYGAGLIKGNTADTLGAPVDLVNAAISPVTKALGIYSDNPVGGSKTFRKLLNQNVEDANAAETVGSLVSVGGAVKAMIVGAARLGKINDIIDIPKAMQMLAKDSHVSDIYNQTGVYVDKDKVLKSVISDKNVTVNMNAFEVVGGQLVPKYSSKEGPVKLSQVINAPEHFALYPELKNIPVRLDPAGQGGSMAKDNSAMTLQSFFADPKGEVPENIRALILHEAQHGIQNLEGFSQGSNPANFVSFDPTRLQKVVTKAKESSDPSVVQAAERLKDAANAKLKEATNRYLNTPGEQEARFTQQSGYLSTEELAMRLLNILRRNTTPQNYTTQLIRPLTP